MFAVIRKINAGMKKLEEFIVGYGTIALAFLLIANVIDRNLFGSKLYFVDEVNTFIIIYITFVGTSYAARNGRHIRMSALSDLVPKKFEKLMMYIMTLGTFIFIGWTTWIVSKYVLDLFSSGRQSSLLQVPLWSIWIIAPIGLGLTTIHYFMAFLKNLKEEDVWISFDEKSEYGEVEEIVEKVGVSELEEEDNEK
ncbi:MAG: TRAP transporter small permease [Halanaerobiaceae bacterium]